MKPKHIIVTLLFTFSNAQISPRLADVSDMFEIPSEVQSLIKSAESRASSAVSEIRSVFSNAATALPPELLSKAREILPVETSKLSASDATPTMEAHLGLVNGVIGAAIGWYMVN
ncbi:hypothetical protein IQ07DRAFT_593717 [Pyrenochaeta sp. DS3sAY3a]|nr:hypothetical protein IQ07DRAFT_593717 [Pyrenochaeta sp. DS3sAY3a]